MATDQPGARARRKRPASRAGEPATIVIVEDQEALAELLIDVLIDAGFRPARAPSAKDAAEFARQMAANVVLLDVVMPERGGWDVLNDLRADPATRETPVVITSAVYDRPGLHSLPSGGPVHFTGKPYDISDLVDAVASLAG